MSVLWKLIWGQTILAELQIKCLNFGMEMKEHGIKRRDDTFPFKYLVHGQNAFFNLMMMLIAVMLLLVSFVMPKTDLYGAHYSLKSLS